METQIAHERGVVIAAVRAFADYLASAPDIPVPVTMSATAVAPGDTLDDRRAAVRHWAEVTGAEVYESLTAYSARLVVGSGQPLITLTVVAAASDRDRWFG